MIELSSRYPVKRCHGLNHWELTIEVDFLNGLHWLDWALRLCEDYFDGIFLCRDNPDLEQPLLQNGEDEDVKTLPKPPDAPDNSLEDPDSTANLQEMADPNRTASEKPKQSWWEWYQKSSVVPIACCIFLCFILKVVQQVYPSISPNLSPPYICLLFYSQINRLLWHCHELNLWSQLLGQVVCQLSRYLYWRSVKDIFKTVCSIENRKGNTYSMLSQKYCSRCIWTCYWYHCISKADTVWNNLTCLLGDIS